MSAGACHLATRVQVGIIRCWAERGVLFLGLLDLAAEIAMPS